MILIAHRGNYNGTNREKENSPEHIYNALNLGYFVEIDLWKTEQGLFLGHDQPVHQTNEKFLDNPNFFVHCKNIEALSYLKTAFLNCEYFWHESDHYTLTSKNNIWVYPGKKLVPGCIAVMPEIDFDGESILPSRLKGFNHSSLSDLLNDHLLGGLKLDPINTLKNMHPHVRVIVIKRMNHA